VKKPVDAGRLRKRINLDKSGSNLRYNSYKHNTTKTYVNDNDMPHS